MHVIAPSEQELQTLATQFSLDVDLLHDALDIYEASRIERDDDSVYVYSRYYHADSEAINATEPMLIIYHPDCLITILRIDSNILKKQLTGVQQVVTTQKTKLLFQILDTVNSSYQGYITKATKQILGVRSKLKRTDINSDALLSLVDVEDDLNEFLSALQPQAILLRNLLSGKFIKLYEEDRDLIEDLSLGTGEIIELTTSRLKTVVNFRQAYDALATSDLNRTFKRLTSISIFMTIPAITAALYGMNLVLPLQGNRNAFWIILAIVMTLTSITIYIFQKKRWL